jgi:hydrogenase expression/formation protein HypD
MKFIDEYHDPKAVAEFAGRIRRKTTRAWNIMEVCGGQTHAIVRHGIDQLLPQKITLLHGPGCPVCVTPVGIIDKAIEIALNPDAIFCSFGDMMRVPGTEKNLFESKAQGADLRLVYSPLDAIKVAQENPEKQVVFFGIGFETTAPAHAMAIYQAYNMRLVNFSVLSALVLIPPAIETILADDNCNVHGFLAAGHVCTITGYQQYIGIAQKYNVPIVVTGFEPLDIIQGIYMVVSQLENGKVLVENQYSRSVRKEGNIAALKIMDDVFEVVDRNWRGFGMIPSSGLKIKAEYSNYDAETRFGKIEDSAEDIMECISGEILRGTRKPYECPAFGTRCTPEKPLGATMVSSEGACSAYYNYRKGSLKIL